MDNASNMIPPDSASPGYHVPVLLKETLDGLDIKPSGIYIDCTFGGGGHSRALLQRLGPGGRLFAFDQDADARGNIPAGEDRLVFVPHNFRHLHRFMRLHKVTQADGIIADLGVSSHQFDAAERGFSTRFEADLDMRMDRRQPLTAAEVVNSYDEQSLHRLFERYGEVTNARTLARAIVAVRLVTSLHTIHQFKAALHGVVKGNPHKYFAQVFQALRIEVNDELGALRDLLEQIPSLLKPGGRAAIITFHSLEDRLVKQFFRKGSFAEEAAHPFESNTASSPLKAITRKPVTAGPEELQRNPRARSAKLRIAEKVSNASRGGREERLV